MSDFEVFGGFDTSDQMDEQAFEKFKERMKANAAHIKALAKSEKKQKKQEDKLAAILLKFIRTHQHSDVVLLISRALEDNIPAFLLLSVVLLGNEDIQEEVGVNFRLPPGIDQIDESSNKKQELVIFDGNQSTLPLKVKLTMDMWGKNVYESCLTFPHKVLGASLIQDGTDCKESLKKLTAAVIFSYLEKNSMQSDHRILYKFSEFFLQGIMKKLKDQLSNQKELDGERSD